MSHHPNPAWAVAFHLQYVTGTTGYRAATSDSAVPSRQKPGPARSARSHVARLSSCGVHEVT